MTALRGEWRKLAAAAAVFAAFFYLPVGQPRFDGAVLEALYLARWYAQEHVLLCLIPAFFIAGALAVFISQGAVMRYLGAKANKFLSYGVASVSGSILAVCSCTVLPLFAGIYRMGAGLGPAAAFLYAGPAINVLAIVLTANVLGAQLGLARALGAVAFSIVIGVLMQWIFRGEEQAKAAVQAAPPDEAPARPLWQNGLYFAALIGVLVFANWGRPDAGAGLWMNIYQAKWVLTAGFALALGGMLSLWFGLAWWKTGTVALATAAAGALWPGQPLIAFSVALAGLSAVTAADRGESAEWFASSWDFAKQILPLLLIGVLIAGFLLGRPGHAGLIPSEWVARAVGGDSLRANFIAAFAGAFMYFATLTEVPIVQGLLDNGMGRGPALALLLAGPALSLPNMLVIRSVLGTKKTAVFIVLVVVMATASGLLFGRFIA